MSRRMTDHIRRLAQRIGAKDSAGEHADLLFPVKGKRTQIKVRRLVRRFVEGKPR